MGAMNTMPEAFDDTNVENPKPTQEEILMSEKDLLQGFLKLDKERNLSESYRKIQIRRRGELLIEFRVRPVTEDESLSCWRRATKYAPGKPGQPKIAIDTNVALFRSWLIYIATVDQDRAKTWDSKKVQEALNVLQGVDIIDKVLLAGEKGSVIDAIDEISGSSSEAGEFAQD